MSTKGREYAVVTFTRVKTRKEADAISDGVRGWAQVVEVHDSRVPCPAGRDHAHARYDGATFCDGCGRYLFLNLEKTL